MRFNLILLFAIVIQLQAGNSYAQKTNIPISMSHVPIEQVLNKIEETSDYVFLYNDITVDKSHVVSVNDSDGNISQILGAIFEGTDISYRIVDKQIILSLEQSDSIQQEILKEVKGEVKDAFGEPLIGVNIIIAGTSSGVITDIDGAFSIKVKKGDVLEFSYIGYSPQKITISNYNPLSIVMKDDAQVLGEIVVTAMGIERKSKSLTYTVETVGGKELTRVKDANLINSLQGKSAGLVITPNANGAGGSSKILLRGNKSISGNNTPLIVIDGVPMANNTNDSGNPLYGGGNDGGDALSTINPDDILSMSILKGASAAALYGSVAANGVIMIKTKHGNEGKIKIDVSSNMTMENCYNLPELQSIYGGKINPSTKLPEKYSWGEKISEYSGEMSEKITSNAKNQLKDFYRLGYNLNNSVALSGGSQYSQVYFSYGNTKSEGVMPTNSFLRHNLSFRESFQLFNEKLTFDLSANYTFSRTKNMPSAGMLDNPITGLYLMPRNLNYEYYRQNYEYADENLLPTQNWIETEENNQNPFWMLNRNKKRNERHRFSLSGVTKYNIFDFLNIQGRMSYERDNSNFRREKYASSWLVEMGDYSENISNYEKLYGDILLSFDKKISNFALTATLGTSFQDEKTTGLGVSGGGVQFELVPVKKEDGSTANLPTGNVYFPNNFNKNNYYNLGVNETYSRSRINSIFGTLQLGYNEMIYLDFTARNDWSSTLAFTSNKHMSFFYPSVGASFLLNEMFSLDEDIFNLLKARVSYSIVGNALPPYRSYPRHTISGTSIASPETMVLTDLKPEKAHSIEAGFDIDLFQNRFHWDVTFYKTNTKNQYFEIEAPWASGYRYRSINAGNVQNMGIETAIGYRFDLGRNWSWYPTINVSYNKNEIKELVPGYNEYLLQEAQGVVMLLKEKGAYGDIYTRELLKDENGNLLLDDNGTPLKSSTRDVYAGNLNAKVHFGWSNTVQWNNLTFYALIDGKIGGKVVSMTEAVLDAYGVSKRSGDMRENGGYINPDETVVDAQKYFVATGATSQSSKYAGMEYIYDATNVRLRELSVGYTFRNLFGISKDLTASIIGRNLFFFYKDSPCDPDTSGSTGNGWQGLDVFNIPTTRSFGLNLKMTF